MTKSKKTNTPVFKDRNLEAIRLLNEGGFTIKEIAEKTKLSETTVGKLRRLTKDTLESLGYLFPDKVYERLEKYPEISVWKFREYMDDPSFRKIWNEEDEKKFYNRLLRYLNMKEEGLEVAMTIYEFMEAKLQDNIRMLKVPLNTRFLIHIEPFEAMLVLDKDNKVKLVIGEDIDRVVLENGSG